MLLPLLRIIYPHVTPCSLFEIRTFSNVFPSAYLFPRFLLIGHHCQISVISGLGNQYRSHWQYGLSSWLWVAIWDDVSTLWLLCQLPLMLEFHVWISLLRFPWYVLPMWISTYQCLSPKSWLTYHMMMWTHNTNPLTHLKFVYHGLWLQISFRF